MSLNFSLWLIDLLLLKFKMLEYLFYCVEYAVYYQYFPSIERLKFIATIKEIDLIAQLINSR